MRPVGWFELLPDLTTFPSAFDPRATLTADQTERLDAISRTAECYGQAVCYGIAGIGELLARIGESSELSPKALTEVGWLLNGLGDLAAKPRDVADGANDRLTAIPQER
jgi:hypothetical protein